MILLMFFSLCCVQHTHTQKQPNAYTWTLLINDCCSQCIDSGHSHKHHTKGISEDHWPAEAVTLLQPPYVAIAKRPYFLSLYHVYWQTLWSINTGH